MNRRIRSIISFSSTVAAATLAATVMAGNARADEITSGTTPFVSQRSRADVQAELFAQRDAYLDAQRTGGGEWALQHNQPQQHTSSLTRQQVRDEYLASRDQVRAMTSEDSGSQTLAQADSQTRGGTTAMAAGTSPGSGVTRAQVRDEYIASRDQVHAMTSEDSGSQTLAQVHPRKPTSNMLAQTSR